MLKWLFGLALVLLTIFATLLVTSKPRDREAEVRQAIATNNADKAQQIVDDMVFRRRKGTNDCFLVRADVYDGRGWAELDAIVIPVSCDGKH